MKIRIRKIKAGQQQQAALVHGGEAGDHALYTLTSGPHELAIIRGRRPRPSLNQKDSTPFEYSFFFVTENGDDIGMDDTEAGAVGIGVTMLAKRHKEERTKQAA